MAFKTNFKVRALVIYPGRHPKSSGARFHASQSDYSSKVAPPVSGSQWDNIFSKVSSLKFMDIGLSMFFIKVELLQLKTHPFISREILLIKNFFSNKISQGTSINDVPYQGRQGVQDSPQNWTLQSRTRQVGTLRSLLNEQLA